MLSVKSVVTFGTDVSEFTWPPMSEKELTRMQRQFPSLVSKLVAAGTDKADGIDPAGNDKSGKADFEYSFIVTQDGKPWHDVVLRYYGLPAQAAEWLKGLLKGEMGQFEGNAKKVKRHR